MGIYIFNWDVLKKYLEEDEADPNSGEGEGLLFYGNVILPFIDRFPTDLEDVSGLNHQTVLRCPE